MTIKRIKNICIALCLILLLGAVSVVPAQAASLSVSVGQSRVSVGNEFSVTIRVSDDVAAWTYQVTYSSNLTLVSGKTMPDGSDDEGSPHINTLLYMASRMKIIQISRKILHALQVVCKCIYGKFPCTFISGTAV